jgi:hypothetical protein
MTITKCDLCKKEIRDEHHGAVSISLGAYGFRGRCPLPQMRQAAPAGHEETQAA